jgi:hypothetical protein
MRRTLCPAERARRARRRPVIKIMTAAALFVITAAIVAAMER